MENIFAKRLKEERILKNLTQQQLADKINDSTIIDKKVSRASITRYETGTRTPDYNTLSAIGSALDIDIDYLIGRSNKKYYSFVNETMSDFIAFLKDIIAKDNQDMNNNLFGLLLDFDFLTRKSIEHDFLKELNIISESLSDVVQHVTTTKNIDLLTNLNELICDFLRDQYKKEGE